MVTYRGSAGLLSGFVIRQGISNLWARFWVSPDYEASVAPLWEIMDKIANDLIALPEWEEGDATWTTATKTDQNARRVVHHIADDIYLSLVMENGTQYNYSSSYRWRGLVIILSSAWDAVGHQPDGTKYYTFAGFEGDSSIVYGDLAVLGIDYRLFICSSGFALVGVPAPNSLDIRQSSFIVVVERNTDKIYVDGFTNFYMFVDGNNYDSRFNSYATTFALFGSTYKWWRYSRAFHLQSQNGYEGVFTAIASKADDEVYFAKPILHNDGSNLSPIYRGEMFIMVDNTRGLVDDDEIALPAPSTKKYQVTIKQSPDSTVYIEYGIMKAE